MTGPTERLPYRATQAAAAYEGVAELPVVALLDDIRSLYNVGAFFRTADAAVLREVFLCGITGRPPKSAISKTALGAGNTVRWGHPPPARAPLERPRAGGHGIAPGPTTVPTRSLV